MNELLPATVSLSGVMLGLSVNAEKIEQAKHKASTVLKFFEDLLDERPYFGSQSITLAEVVAGTIVPWLPRTGLSLSDYPKLSAWCVDAFTQRVPLGLSGLSSDIACLHVQHGKRLRRHPRQWKRLSLVWRQEWRRHPQLSRRLQNLRHTILAPPHPGFVLRQNRPSPY